MSETTDFIAKITEKLHHDRELRLDISHELQTHLDEAIEEYKASDYCQEDALAAAIKDMGDAEELAEDLWQANRRRMKLRAWCWWIARLALWPACLVVTLAFMIAGVGVTGMLADPSNMGHTGDFGGSSGLVEISRRYFNYRIRSGMTPTQQLIAFGDETAKDASAQWIVLRDAFPNEPLYQLNYIQTLFPKAGYYPSSQNKTIDLPLVLTELERGRVLEPDNGIYDLLEALVYLPQNIKFVEDTSRGFELMSYGRGNRAMKMTYPMIPEEPVESQQVGRIITCLNRAVAHRYITTHAFDMLRHRMAQLPEARTMREYLFRVGNAISISLGSLGRYRQLARLVGATALRQAEEGHADEATHLLDTLDCWQQKAAASSTCAIELLVVRSILVCNQINRAFVYEIRGEKTLYENEIAAIRASEQKYKEQFIDRIHQDRNDPRIKDGGLILGAVLPALPGFEIDVRPFRMAEYAMLDRGALSIVLVSLLILAALLSVQNVWRLLNWNPNHPRPLLLWSGMWSFSKVLLWSVGLPVLVFAVLIQTPLMRRDTGLGNNMMSLYWYVLLFVAMLMLLWFFAADAMRLRAKSLGLTVPGRASRLRLVSTLLVFGMLVGTLSFCIHLNRSQGVMGGDMTVFNVLFTVGLIMLCTIIWFLIARQIAWLHGIASWVSRAVWSLTIGLGSMLLLLGVLSGVFLYIAPSQDFASYVATTGVICVPIGLLLSWGHLASIPGECHMFARSVSRTLPVFLLVTGILLAMFVGQSLYCQEAHYTHQIQAQSPIFVDVEIEHSNLRTFRAQWAAGQPKPPPMVPREVQP